MSTALSITETTSLPVNAFVDKISVVRVMLGTLETLTSAGQQYLMSKIIGFIDDEARRLSFGMRLRNRRAFIELLTHLRRESDRSFPDVATFIQRADGLLLLLGGGR